LLRSGVDGVHWSALPADSGYVVVMTVPAAQRPNLVVGTSVLEFLGLGCVGGYATLDLLATDPSSALPAADELDEAALSVLARLRLALDLHQWKDVPGRLRLLEQRFGRPVPRATLPDTPHPDGLNSTSGSGRAHRRRVGASSDNRAPPECGEHSDAARHRRLPRTWGKMPGPRGSSSPPTAFAGCPSRRSRLWTRRGSSNVWSAFPRTSPSARPPRTRCANPTLSWNTRVKE